ncbi:hypothetical protein AB1Y20_023439 [Prymnesium parvum]|uniref:FH2 domain-containing protein n=1 Tax=Prymnesium parvum TaxID=97485 RepID=A0AB34JG95_PRYPA
MPVADAGSACPDLTPVLRSLGLQRFARVLAARRVTLTRLRTGAAGGKELRACGMAADDAMALMLAVTSSKCGWAHAPSVAQSIVEWDALLRSFDVGLEHHGPALARSRLRAQSLALNLASEAQLVGAGVPPDDAARLCRCARIFQAAAYRLALDLAAPRAHARPHPPDPAESDSAGASVKVCVEGHTPSAPPRREEAPSTASRAASLQLEQRLARLLSTPRTAAEQTSGDSPSAPPAAAALRGAGAHLPPRGVSFASQGAQTRSQHAAAAAPSAAVPRGESARPARASAPSALAPVSQQHPSSIPTRRYSGQTTAPTRRCGDGTATPTRRYSGATSPARRFNGTTTTPTRRCGDTTLTPTRRYSGVSPTPARRYIGATTTPTCRYEATLPPPPVATPPPPPLATAAAAPDPPQPPPPVLVSDSETCFPSLSLESGPRGPPQFRTWHWTKVSAHRATGSLWRTAAEKAQEHEDVAADLLEAGLEEHFSRKPPPQLKRVASVGSAMRSSSGPKRLSVLEGKRAYIFDIELAQFRTSFELLAETVRELDPYDELQLDQIEGLLKLLPTEEELSRVGQLEAELCAGASPAGEGMISDKLSHETWESLTRTEQFLLAFCRIPRLAQRLHVIAFMRMFDAEFAGIKARLELLADAAHQVRSSAALVAFLEACLLLGNFLNRGTTYANAKGFTMSSLQQLVQIKSSVDKSSLMELVVSRLPKWAPEAAALSDELSLVKPASRETVGALNETLGEIRAGAARLFSELEELPPSTLPPEVVKGSLQVRLQCRAAALLVLQTSVAGIVFWVLYPSGGSGGAKQRAGKPPSATEIKKGCCSSGEAHRSGQLTCTREGEWHVLRLSGLKEGAEYSVAFVGERDCPRRPTLERLREGRALSSPRSSILPSPAGTPASSRKANGAQLRRKEPPSPPLPPRPEQTVLSAVTTFGFRHTSSPDGPTPTEAARKRLEHELRKTAESDGTVDAPTYSQSSEVRLSAFGEHVVTGMKALEAERERMRCNLEEMVRWLGEPYSNEEEAHEVLRTVAVALADVESARESVHAQRREREQQREFLHCGKQSSASWVPADDTRDQRSYGGLNPLCPAPSYASVAPSGPPAPCSAASSDSETF